MGTPTKLITYEDSLALPENKLEEIVHGESRLMPPPNFFHALLLRRLTRLLQAQLDENAYAVFGQDIGLGIEREPLTYRIPGLMVYRVAGLRRDRQRSAANDPYLWAPPDLLVECLSPANRKGAIEELLSDYQRISVPEVWLLDPESNRFSAHILESGTYRQAESTSERVSPLLLPNVRIDLVDLWRAFQGNL